MKSWYSFMWQLGKISGCHQLPERSFYFNGKQFPVCARCTGAFVGYYFGFFLFFIFDIPVWISLLFCFLMFLDWFFQNRKWLYSTNSRRFITGFLCGIGLMQLCIRLLVVLITKILTV